MQTIPPEQWEHLCAELSGALGGRVATFEAAADGGAELIVLRSPFDGLRLERRGAAARLVACAGGRALWAAEAPTRLAVARDAAGDARAIVVELAGRPALSVTFEPEGGARRAARALAPARERAVGAEAG